MSGLGHIDEPRFRISEKLECVIRYEGDRSQNEKKMRKTLCYKILCYKIFLEETGDIALYNFNISL